MQTVLGEESHRCIRGIIEVLENDVCVCVWRMLKAIERRRRPGHFK